MFSSGTYDPRQSARQKGIQGLRKGSTAQVRVLGDTPQSSSTYVTANQPLVDTLAQAWDFQMGSIESNLIQGGYFDFEIVDPNSGGIIGNIGYGPNGPNWNVNGSPSRNPYVPGTFAVSDIDATLPVLKRGQEPVKPETFRLRYLAGMHEAFQFLGNQFEETFRFYWRIALGDLESRLGLFIWPRVIICDGIERGFNPGVDFDLEEREYDFQAREFYNWGWMTLRYRPVMQIIQLNMVYPTGEEILAFPGSWIKPQMLSGQIRLVPPQGALSQIVLGPGGLTERAA